jgi:hypothetical protein
MLYHAMSSCHIVSYRIISYITSYISYCIVSCRIVSYRIIYQAIVALRTLFSGQKLLTVIFDLHFGLRILCALRIGLVIAAQFRLISPLFYLTTVGCHFLLACLLYRVIHTERPDRWCPVFCNDCSERSLLRPRHVTGVNRQCFQSTFRLLPIILSGIYSQNLSGVLMWITLY